MKLQNIYVNDRFDHVLDYDSNNSVVEKFIIQSPVTGTSISLIAFSTHRNENYFCIETEEKTEHYFFHGGSLNVDEDDDGLKRVTVNLNFSYKPNANASRASNDAQNSTWGDSNVRNEVVRRRQDICNFENRASICWDGVDGDSKQVLCLNINGLHASCIEVDVTLNLECQEQFGDVTRTKSLVIYVAPVENISDVILDFGSEASQMAVFRRDGQMDINGFSDLYPNIKLKLTGQDFDERTELNYHQYDDSSRKLFKSQFFIRRNVEREEVKTANANPLAALMSVENRPEMMKVLTTKEEVQSIKADYFQAPNVKLSGFGGIDNLPHVVVGNQSFAVQNVRNYLYYRASVSLFIQQALDEVLIQENDRDFVSFHFMMPNVYEQQEIVKILHLLQQDIEDMLRNQEGYSNVKGIEVTAISESDASVMGVCELLRQNNRQLPEGNYLLLDAGKGTLDFSLIKYEFDNRNNEYVYKNLWRSGIVGAGNSLTYAYLLALIHKYLESRVNGNIGDDEIRRFIYGNILGRKTRPDGTAIPTAGDSALLLRMMRAVDRYKRCTTFRPYPMVDDAVDRTDNLDILELGSFVDWLEECVNEENRTIVGLEHSEYVDDMIRALVDETVKKICDFRALRGEEYRIDKVIFSGRAFNLQSFKNKMLNCLRQIYTGIKEINFTDNRANTISMKNICLACANPIRYGNYNRKILSEPFLIQQRNVNEMNESATNDNTAVQEKSFFAGILRGFLSMFSNSEPQNNADVRSADIRNSTFLNNGVDLTSRLEMFTSVSRLQAPGNNGMPLEGYEWTVNNPESLSFNIGGKSYLPNGNIGRGVVKLFFTGERYIWRTGQNCGSFRQTMNFANSPFLQSSFFPSFVPNRLQDICLIPLMDEEQTGTGNEAQDNVETPSSSNAGDRTEPADDELNELGKLLQNNK